MAHDKAFVASLNALGVILHVYDPHLIARPTTFVLSGFLGGLNDMSMLPLYAHHNAKNVWEGM